VFFLYLFEYNKSIKIYKIKDLTNAKNNSGEPKK